METLCGVVEAIRDGCDISNDYTLVIEIILAVSLAVGLPTYFYKKEQRDRKEPDELIKKQSIKIDEMSKTNEEQQKLIKSMKRVIDEQESRLLQQEKSIMFQRRYVINEIINVLNQIIDTGNKYLVIINNPDKLNKLKKDFETINFDESRSKLGKVLKEALRTMLEYELPSTPNYLLLQNLLSQKGEILDALHIDKIQKIMHNSKTYFDFVGLKKPLILTKNLEFLQTFLNNIKQFKLDLQKVIEENSTFTKEIKEKTKKYPV